MAIAEIDRKRIEAWCDSRIPAHVRNQIQVVAAFRGNSAAIIETRPPWRDDFDPEWTRSRIAKLVFDPTSNTWQLFARDRNDRLLEYSNEFGIGSKLADALAAIKADVTGIFWG